MSENLAGHVLCIAHASDSFSVPYELCTAHVRFSLACAMHSTCGPSCNDATFNFLGVFLLNLVPAAKAEVPCPCLMIPDLATGPVKHGDQMNGYECAWAQTVFWAPSQFVWVEIRALARASETVSNLEVLNTDVKPC